MTMLERAIDAAAGRRRRREPRRVCVASSREQRSTNGSAADWLFYGSTLYNSTGIIEEGEVEIVRGLRGDEHLLYILGNGSMDR